MSFLEKKKKKKKGYMWCYCLRVGKKKERKKVHVLESVGKKKRVGKKKKKVENANSGKRGFGMRIQTHT